MSLSYHDNGLMRPESPFFMFIFMGDDKKYETERVVFNIFDALTATGGFASVITLIFTLLTMRIQKVLFYRDITSKIFLYHEPPK